MKISAIFILVFTILLSTVPTALANDSLNGIQIYPPDYIWNVPIDTLPVHPMSDTYLSVSHPEGFIYLAKAFPINVVNSSQPQQKLTYIQYASSSDNIPIPIPDNPLLETLGSDRHMFIVDRDTKISYELFSAVQAPNGTWSSRGFTWFNLSDYTLRPHGVDAAGMPMIPGIIRYDEIVAGEINHATRFGTEVNYGTYVWPAQAGSVVKDPTYPPYGQRFRLKSSFNTSGYSTTAKIILESWKKYGIILADDTGGTAAWTLCADEDPGWNDNYALFSEFTRVHGSDFEAVNATVLMINKNSGQARITPIVTPTPTPTKTPKQTPISLFPVENKEQIHVFDLGNRLKIKDPPLELILLPKNIPLEPPSSIYTICLNQIMGFQ